MSWLLLLQIDFHMYRETKIMLAGKNQRQNGLNPCIRCPGSQHKFIKFFNSSPSRPICPTFNDSGTSCSPSLLDDFTVCRVQSSQLTFQLCHGSLLPGPGPVQRLVWTFQTQILYSLATDQGGRICGAALYLKMYAASAKIYFFLNKTHCKFNFKNGQ